MNFISLWKPKSIVGSLSAETNNNGLILYTQRIYNTLYHSTAINIDLSLITQYSSHFIHTNSCFSSSPISPSVTSSLCRSTFKTYLFHAVSSLAVAVTIASTHCADSWMDGQAELTWVVD